MNIVRSVLHLIGKDIRNYNQKTIRSYCTQQSKQINKHTLRSHTCGELRLSNVGDDVTICGWLQFNRMNQFAVIRDAYGMTQVLLPEEKEDFVKLLEKAPLESIILVKGRVIKRPDDQVNKKMSTGEVEVVAEEFTILNQSSSKLPFTIRDYKKANETLRMKYRYLDLRFPNMQHNLRLRSDVLMKMRNFLALKRGFVEVETPTLFKKTPGGAQEFVVPTQSPGDFYSLVQSPQQLKQLLMIGGIDRYFQIARCYRDETARPDRQPEFTQLDIELSFADSECVISLVEDLIVDCLPEDLDLKSPFPRITFSEAMENYGTDQPDISITCKLKPLNIDLPNGVEARFLKIPNSAVHLKNSLKDSFVKLKNMISPEASLNILKNPGSNWDNFAEKLIGWEGSGNELKQNLQVKEGDLVFLSIGPKTQVLKLLGKIRSIFVNILRENGLTGEWEDKNVKSLVWVVDFPLFEMNEEGTGIKSAHHPFTSPHPDDIHLLKDNPLQVRGLHYDLVMNGWEIGGGSVRIHSPQMQNFILKNILNIPTQDLQHLLDALESGAPPHAGVALGIDRLISILVGAKSIRDVIAFPKSSDAKDLMTGAPCPLPKEDLQLYNIEVLRKDKRTISVPN